MPGPEELVQNVAMSQNQNQMQTQTQVQTQDQTQTQQLLGANDWAFDQQGNLLVSAEAQKTAADDYVVVEKPKVEGRTNLLLKLDQYKSFWGDGNKLAKIKKATKVFESFLLKDISSNQKELSAQVAEMKQQYLSMIAMCDEYIDAHRNESKGAPKARLAYVIKLKALNVIEYRNIDAALKQYHEGATENRQELAVTLGDLATQARILKTAPATGAVIVDQTNKEMVDKRCAQYHLGVLLGEEDLFVKTDLVKEKGTLKYQTDMSKLEDYHKASDIFGDEKVELVNQNRMRIVPDVLKKINAIKVIEDILQISINNESIYYKVEKKQEQVGDHTIERSYITDVRVCENEMGPMLSRTHTDAEKKQRLIIDTNIAKALRGLSVEGVARSLSAVFSAEQVSNFKTNIKNVRQKMNNSGSRIVYDDEWSKEGASYLEHLRKPGMDLLQKVVNEYGLAKNDPNYVKKYDYSKTVKKEKEVSFLRFRLVVEGDQNVDLQQVQNATQNQILDQMQQQQQLDDLKAIIAAKKKGKPPTDREKRAMDADDMHILDSAKLARLKRKSEKGEKLEMPNLVLNPNIDAPLFNNGVPSVEDIKQGEVGDCYLMAALLGIVRNNPKAISDILEDRGSCVDVHFKGYPGVITVSKATVEEVRKDAQGNVVSSWDHYASGALWVKIIEKAYARIGFGKAMQDWEMKDNDIKSLIKFINANKNKVSGDRELSALFKYYSCNLGLNIDRARIDYLYSHSIEAIGGGSCEEALKTILGIHSDSKNFKMVTADDMSSEYSTLWGNAKKGINKRNERGRLEATRGDAFDDKEEVLGDILKGLLKKELQYRHSRTYKKEDGSLQTISYKNVSLEDITDTLRDIRNWTSTDYNSVLLEFKKKYFDAQGRLFDEKVFFDTLNSLAEKLYKAGNACEKFEHEAFAKDSTGKFLYTNKAKNVAKYIQHALGEGAVTFGTKDLFEKADQSEATGLNGEKITDGMVYNHAYMVLDIRETQQGQILVKAVNPWGVRGLKYTEKRVNGKTVIQRELDHNKDHGGVFEMDLNDFLRFADVFNTSKSAVKKNKALYKSF